MSTTQMSFIPPGRLRPLFAATMAVLAGGCTSNTHADTPPYDEDLAPCQQVALPPQPFPNEVPGAEIADGQINAAVAQVDQLARALLDWSHIPGMAVAVVHDGQTVFAKGYGVRSVDTGAAVDADTVFQLASVSKSVGATVVAHQVGVAANHLRWDTPVQQLLPSFQLKDPYVSSHLTIADLYTHRSGLPPHVGDLLEDLGYTRAQSLEKLRLIPLAPFRAVYAYTNFGMTAAAEAVATASGMDWATLSQHVIYEPLGMSSTSSRYADFLARPNRAVGHIQVNDRFVVTSTPRDPDTQAPAGGVSSSVNDMTRWMNMVLGRGHVNGNVIVESCALLAAISPQSISGAPATPSARGGFYGYGFNVGDSAAGRVVITHSGAFALGTATAFTLIPSANIGIVTLTNAPPVGVPESLNAQFADLVQFGRVTQDWRALYEGALKPLLKPQGELLTATPPASPTPARALNTYAGVYRNSYYGDAIVKAMNGTLTLSLGPSATQFPLQHWDGDIFSFAPPGESEPQGSISKATFGEDTLTIEYLDHEYSGVFTRRDNFGPAHL